MQTVNLHEHLSLVYSEIADGNIDLRFSPPATVKANRKAIFKSLNLNPYQIIEGHQIHENRLLPLDEENIKMWRGQSVTGVDGFVTNRTEINLMLRVADCLPLVLFDPVKHALAIAHIGWRGAVAKIHLRGLEYLVKRYATEPHEVLAWFGPSALVCHYLSADTPQQLDDEAWKPFLTKTAQGYRVDIAGYVAGTLKDAGVLKKNQHYSGICTVESANLFSHQRSLESGTNDEGRFAVIAALK